VVLVLIPLLVMWFRVVHQDDEILALVRNEVAADAAGQRTWHGSFVNTNDTPLRDVAVTVDFLDTRDLPVGNVEASAAEMLFGARLDLHAALPPGAAKIRIQEVRWRRGDKTAVMGPFRDPWEFGYLMADPAKAGN